MGHPDLSQSSTISGHSGTKKQGTSHKITALRNPTFGTKMLVKVYRYQRTAYAWGRVD